MGSEAKEAQGVAEKVIIHEKGPKAERDRRNFMAKYDELCRYFKVKPEPTHKLNSHALYRLGEDLWNKLPTKTKTRYLEDRGLIPRSNPLAFKWFIRDGLRILRGWRRVWFVVSSPVRYIFFRGRNA